MLYYDLKESGERLKRLRKKLKRQEEIFQIRNLMTYSHLLQVQINIMNFQNMKIKWENQQYQNQNL